MKPKSWNSIARVFFRFASMGKVEKTRFERNWTTFANQAFIAAWNSPPKMVVWNWPRGIRSQGCFIVSPQWGKSKKHVLNAIGRPSSTRLLSLLGIAHPKWWYETDLVEFDRKGVFSFRPDGESRKNAFWTQLDDLGQPVFYRCLEKPKQNNDMKPTSRNSIPRVFFRFVPMGKVEKTRFERNWTTFVNPAFSLLGITHPKWCYETEIVEFDRKCVFSFRLDGESRKNAFWTQLDDLRQPVFYRCLEKPKQNNDMKPTSRNSIPRVFFRFARWGKSKKRVLNAIGRPSSTRLLSLLGIAHPKWWYETEIRSQGCFFVSSRWGKSKKRVLNAIWRPSSTRLFALLGKAQPKWWYETKIVEFDRNGVFSFRPMGKVEKTRFQRNWTTFVNQAFIAAWNSPPKMVVWNWPRGIRSQGCLIVSPQWGKSKKRVLNAIGRPSSTRLLSLLGIAHPKWWYETDLVEFERVFFRFALMGKVEKTRFHWMIVNRSLLGKAK